VLSLNEVAAIVAQVEIDSKINEEVSSQEGL
jgi:hypothetical protein